VSLRAKKKKSIYRHYLRLVHTLVRRACLYTTVGLGEQETSLYVQTGPPILHRTSGVLRVRRVMIAFGCGAGPLGVSGKPVCQGSLRIGVRWVFSSFFCTSFWWCSI